MPKGIIIGLKCWYMKWPWLNAKVSTCSEIQLTDRWNEKYFTILYVEEKPWISLNKIVNKPFTTIECFIKKY